MSLKGVIVRRKGEREYRYLRRAGKPLVKLPADVPMDHPKFLAAYAAARTDDPAPTEPGTVGALVTSALRGDRYKALSTVYRATLRRHFDAIRAAYGKAPARGLKRRHIEADLGKAANAADRLKAWRFLAAHGTRAGLLADDATQGIVIEHRGRVIGHEPWSADEIAAYRARWPVGTVPRAAMELLFWSAARIDDGAKIGPGMVDREGVLTFRQHKTGGLAHVPWTCALPAYAAGMQADRDVMHAALAPLAGQMTFLATAHGRTRSTAALGTLIRESARAAGVERSAHGLRKARATALAEAGATTHQIAAWTGHESLKEVEHYTRRAGRRAAVMGENGNRTLETGPRQSGNR
ncbi:tyrosine-type recombinase/integrase [Jannaschia formosa]|uniref:tyrosine-type recombinase/integrase n=1 Tax=Jannaschia formosa TaxID=2259592 RepID=UPI001FD84076|nr:tyrosine-type recombinase/integrase [Jannaschia formosa]